jgi:diguanylate cyclase (GGDEF)-like protein/PAS domain S-box-containing protein
MTKKRGTSESKNELSEEFFRNIFLEAGDGIFLVDAQGLVIEANPRGCEMLGFSREEIIGLPLMKYVPLDESNNVLKKLGTLAIGQSAYGESAFIRKDGSRIAVEISGRPLSNGQVLGLMRDISERKQAEQTLIESEQKFRSLVEHSPDGIIIVDESGCIIEWNQGQEDIAGLKRSEVLGKPIWDIQFQLMPEELRSEAYLARMKQSSQKILASGHGPGLNQPRETTLQLSDGTPRTIESILYTYKTNAGYRVGGITRDITRRKQIELLLEYLAMHDGLTDLPNRQLFRDRLELALERVRRGQRGILAVMMIDLDNFKNVNDTYGHAYGDQLLKLIAQRLQGCLRKSDTAARMGGDEFALINEEVANFESCKLIATKVLDVLSQPLEIEGQNLAITASIGISLYTPSSNDAATLLRQADMAMYNAKQSRNCYRFYDSALQFV